MKSIGDFEIVDHGIQYSVDYKSKDGRYIVTGFGKNMAEAIHDCLHQIHGFNTENMEKRILEQMNWGGAFPTEPSADVWDNRRFKDHCVSFYYISILWSEA